MADEKLYDAYGIEVDKHGHRKRKPLSQKDIVFENGQPRVIKHRNLTEEQREAKRERLKKVREMTMQREDNPYFKPKAINIAMSVVQKQR